MLVLGLASLAVSICYLLLQIKFSRSWRRIEKFSGLPLATPKVSIIVPMRDEEDRIMACMRSLIRQDYPSFEIVVVDNHSSDRSADLVEQLEDDRVRLIRLDQFLDPESTFKKEAIEYGVGTAAADIILTTDGDCVCPPQWIATMVHTLLSSDSDYVAGPIALATKDSGFLSLYQRLSTDGLAVVTGAGMESKWLLSSFGANHGYRKSAFLEVGGYRNNRNFRSGDDVFLLQEMVAAGLRVQFVKAQEATVISYPEDSWMTFLMQNLRWVSKSKGLAHRGTTLVSVLPFLVNLCLLLMLGGVLSSPDCTYLFLAVFGIKVIADTLILRLGVRFNRHQYPIATWIAAHLVQPLLVVGLVMSSLFLKPTWKSRTI